MERLTLGSFETIQRVGAGGMGEVWKGLHTASKTPVAIKFLHPKQADRPDARAAFLAEATAIARLSHPRIVRIYDVGEVDGVPYLVMQWADASLDAVTKPCTWDQARQIGLEVLDGLAHIHARGIVHRDIKPSNILGRPGRLRIADFGIAHVRDGADDTNPGRSGTPYFMAPEQFSMTAGAVGSWTDLYAVGCMMWLLLTGKVPFEGPSFVKLATEHIHQPFPLEGLSEPMHAWFVRMISKNPHGRFRFAAEAARELVAVPQPFEHELPPGFGAAGDPELATNTLPLTTILLDVEIAAKADASASPATASLERLPDWRASHAARTHVEHASGASLTVASLRTPAFTGRETERDALWEDLRAVHRTQRPKVRVVSGAVGTGRRALCRWLGERAEELGAAVSLGSVSATAQTPFVDVARRELGLDERSFDLTDDRLRQRGWSTTLSDEERNAAAGLVSGSAPYRSLAARTSATIATLRLCAAGRTLVLTIDHAESMGPEIRQILDALERTSLPLLVLLTSLDPSGDDDLRLETMSDSQIARILNDTADLDRTLVAEIVDHARGNPGVAMHALQDLLASSALQPGDTGLRRTGEFELRGFDEPWADRLDWLHRSYPTLGRALEVAAWLGADIAREDWEIAAEALGLDASKAWSSLEALGFVRRTSSGWALESPQLVDEARARARKRSDAVSDLRTLRRTPLCTGARAPRWAEELGDFWSAVLGYIEVARDAQDRALSATVARELVGARRCLVRLPDDAERARLECEVQLMEAISRSGDRLEEGDALAAAVVERAEAHGWDDLLGQALELRGRIARKRVQLELAVELLEQAERASARAGEDQWVAAARQGLGHIAMIRGEFDAAAALLKAALELATGSGAAHTAAWCCNSLGDLCRKQQRIDEAVEWYARAADLFVEQGDGQGLLWCAHDLGLARREAGDLEAATVQLRRSVEIARRLGIRVVAPRLNLGLVEVLAGSPRQARFIFEEVLEESRLRGVEGEAGLAHACLLPCAAAEHRWDEVRQHLEQATTLLGSLEDHDLGRMAQIASRTAEDEGEADLALQLRAFAKRHGVT